MECTLCGKEAKVECGRCHVYRFCSADCTRKMRKVHNTHCMEFMPAEDMLVLRASLPKTHPLAAEYNTIASHTEPDALEWAGRVLDEVGASPLDAWKLLSPDVRRHYLLLIRPQGVDYYLARLGELDPVENKKFLKDMLTAVNSMAKLSIWEENRERYVELLRQIKELQARGAEPE